MDEKGLAANRRIDLEGLVGLTDELRLEIVGLWRGDDFSSSAEVQHAYRVLGEHLARWIAEYESPAQISECKACAHRNAAGFDGQCPSCATERTLREREVDRG